MLRSEPHQGCRSQSFAHSYNYATSTIIMHAQRGGEILQPENILARTENRTQPLLQQTFFRERCGKGSFLLLHQMSRGNGTIRAIDVDGHLLPKQIRAHLVILCEKCKHSQRQGQEVPCEYLWLSLRVWSLVGVCVGFPLIGS